VSSVAPAISVVVVSHNSGPLLRDCAERVLAQPVALELIVVDNASDDGCPQRLPADPRLRLLVNRDNPGFGVACNQGAQAAQGELLLFLNPDCLLPPDALPRLQRTLADAAGVGLLGAQLLEADGRLQPAARRPLPRLTGSWRRSGSLGVDPASGAEWVEATSGALMLMPRAVFAALGGFDEGYRLHCEDLDLCRRLDAAGWRIAIDPQVRVVHVKGRSSQRRPLWVEWQKHRGMLRYLRKFERSARTLYPLLWLAVWARYPWAAARAWWLARSAAGRA
jgi:N-acetylglucosaminyl-diphospho-decaprenol L-rhamnosyltransferase